MRFRDDNSAFRSKLSRGVPAAALSPVLTDTVSIVLATGAVRTAPEIPGKSQRHVFDGDELRGILFGTSPQAAAKLNPLYRLMVATARMAHLLRSVTLLRFLSRIWMPIADEVVIIGGGLVGLELAEYLVERGRRVTVLEPGPALGPELAIVRRARVLHKAAVSNRKKKNSPASCSRSRPTWIRATATVLRSCVSVPAAIPGG